MGALELYCIEAVERSIERAKYSEKSELDQLNERITKLKWKGFNNPEIQKGVNEEIEYLQNEIESILWNPNKITIKSDKQIEQDKLLTDEWDESDDIWDQDLQIELDKLTEEIEYENTDIYEIQRDEDSYKDYLKELIYEKYPKKTANKFFPVVLQTYEMCKKHKNKKTNIGLKWIMDKCLHSKSNNTAIKYRDEMMKLGLIRFVEGYVQSDENLKRAGILDPKAHPDRFVWVF